jgi:hypothetical protein
MPVQSITKNRFVLSLAQTGIYLPAYFWLVECLPGIDKLRQQAVGGHRKNKRHDKQ